MRVFWQRKSERHRSQGRAPRRPVRWSYALTAALPILLVLLLGRISTPLAPDLNNLVFDWYQRHDPRQWTPQSPIRIVDIDDESLVRLGQWPWRRSMIAEIVRRLGDLGAVAIAVDIVFAEPDGSSPEQVIGLLPATPGRTTLEQELRNERSNDAKLAAAISAVPTVLGAFLTSGPDPVDYPVKHGIATAGDDPASFLAQFTGAVMLAAGGDVFANEVVRTGDASNAQLVFLDRTNLGVGPKSSVTLDRFVYDPDRGTGRVVVRATRGIFRFVTGSQPSQDYTIETPLATIGVRGTIFDLLVQQTRVIVVLVSGEVRVTPRKGRSLFSASQEPRSRSLRMGQSKDRSFGTAGSSMSPAMRRSHILAERARSA
jgi:hypothetical protein